MNGLIRFSLRNPIAITVTMLTLVILGTLSYRAIPIDILPVFKSPAVQVLTFYGGMPAVSVEKDITNRMERWTGQAAGTKRQESRSIVGASIVRNYYHDGTDPSGALTQVNSLATAAIPSLPPGTLPPVVLPFDPTSTVPACLVALDSQEQTEATLYDVGRYEVRNMVMGIPGAVAPVVYGGKLRAVMAYIDRDKLQARNLSPVDVMNALDAYNLFLPTGDAKFGSVDFALDSNSMYDFVERMGDIPLKTEHGNAVYLRDVAKARDASMIQTNIVRVNGRRQVYVPVYRQIGASTLAVVDKLKQELSDMQARLTRPGIDLKVVMDQSVYVRSSIHALIQEGVLGAVLCSMVILLFLGEWKMTLIAVITIPLAVLAAGIGLYYTGNTLNVMTLAGLSLAIGPLVDSAIICLENTHRHLGLGAKPHDAAFLGASEVAMPELVASCCTLLVLAPLAFMPGMGAFLFRPMAMAVAFAMGSAYLLSRSFVPVRCALWLRSHTDHHSPLSRGPMLRLFNAWEAAIESGIQWYCRRLDWVLRRRLPVLATALVLLVSTVILCVPVMRREFFPEVDSGAFEIYVRAPSGTRIEVTEENVAAVEDVVREKLEHDLELLVSELGVVPDWSAAYTPNAGPMDAVIKVQLTEERERSAQEYVKLLRSEFAQAPQLAKLEFAFDAGGMIRGAMNEGKSSPINIRIKTKSLEKGRSLAEAIYREVTQVPGVVDARILQRLDYPQYVIDVDRSKAADLGLTQGDIMRNVVAAFNSSIQFNKRNFWIDPVSNNQYFVGVQYDEDAIDSTETLLDIPITSDRQRQPIPLRNVATLRRASVPTEVSHTNIQPTIDLTMGIVDRDLGHVADDVKKVVQRFGSPSDEPGVWLPYDPAQLEQQTPLPGSKLEMSGEYARMQETFSNLGAGLILASILVYFLMAGLFKSYVTPLVIMSAVPLGLVGVIIMLYLTGTAINVQSLLGVIFMVGIVVSNTVLLVDFATHLREAEGLSPTAAIRKAASIRVRPVVMTAIAAFFALIPMALAVERGSEANAPLGRAVIGGLLAGLLTTLFVVPALYSLLIRGTPSVIPVSADSAPAAAMH
jgi:multidrug efflux pump subunit AcrB